MNPFYANCINIDLKQYLFANVLFYLRNYLLIEMNVFNLFLLLNMLINLFIFKIY